MVLFQITALFAGSVNTVYIGIYCYGYPAEVTFMPVFLALNLFFLILV